ncbi:bifunctional glutamate N-acetyltransferase/amino-acid acetyltransferase ArgJ [Neptunomonas japonica]|uniref:Arginine biosynthesis bifunctional protein ArgJ n=1 Tax=Neptunomonas japonica JAMM 1380 TaxID=1441457 RepID=A0A7R6P806_9GAMM|nr:bifunctional glutamate N-acetyltransferase/amino-acid acetyltransferase ArgJ [Neptunomonas japonica]BBB28924.1 glutamate N-acetyltransferase/amino-acid N-acetyltransferase [Neptunomonas japonica JAMM 1380]
MAIGPATLPVLHPVNGVRLGVASAGVKTAGRKDVVVIEMAKKSTLAGVFTKNAFCAAPVIVSKEHLNQGKNRFLLINTGNANAGTGEKGLKDAYACCSALADAAHVNQADIMPFSTGVIGEPLPVDKIINVFPAALDNLDENHWAEAAEGILTTDTRPKGACVQFIHEGQTITITGISKGSGMIMPNMATMLGFVATDAAISSELLQSLLVEAADLTFNRITIDGDTSTNDSCMLIATGQSGAVLTQENEALYRLFKDALHQVMLELSLAIVKDGEGATKLVTIRVEQAATQEEALATAYTVAHSPLVKTALFASDPNWGRILAAVGRAGVENLQLNDLQIYLDEVCIVENGGRADSYTEEAGKKVMSQENILIKIVLNRGIINETVWTTDLSHDYVTINADYRS